MMAPLPALEDFAATWLGQLAWASAAGLLLLAALRLASARLARRPALSHQLWLVACAGLLAMPLLRPMLPAHTIELPARSVAERAQEPTTSKAAPAAIGPGATTGVALASPVVPGSLPRPAEPREASPLAWLGELRATTWLFLGWELGLLVVLLGTALGWRRARQLLVGSVPLAGGSWSRELRAARADLGLDREVELRRSPQEIGPLTLGIRTPVVLLPASSEGWDGERQEVVLKHELAHVARLDVASQLFARVVAAVFWFHPLPWVALRAMRRDREAACDDRVIEGGLLPSRYAQQLLEVARERLAPAPAPVAVVGMARGPELGARVQALLDPQRSHGRTGRAPALAMSLLVLLLLSPAAWLEAAQSPVVAPPVEGPGRAVVAGDPPPAPEPPRRGERGPRGEAPPAPSLPGIPDLPDMPGLPALALGHLEDDGDLVVELGDSRSQWNWNDGRRRIELEMRGTLEFAPGLDGLASMGEDGRFELEYRQGRERHRVEARPSGGDISWRYWHQGDEQDFEPAGREWLEESLPDVLSEAGLFTGYRVRTRYEEEGFDRTLEWARERGSDHAVAMHLAALGRLEAIGSGERARVLEALGGEVDSGFELARALAFLAPGNLDDEGTQRAWIDAAGHIDSDFELARVLLIGAREANPGPAARQALLALAGEIGSDFELARVLVHLAPTLEGEEDMDAWLAAAEGIGSDFELVRVYAQFLERQSPPPALVARLLRHSQALGSDYERARLLAVAAPHAVGDEESEEAWEDAAGQIGSDFEYGRALRAWREAQREPGRI